MRIIGHNMGCWTVDGSQEIVNKRVHVACVVLVDEYGHVLIGKRNKGKIKEGFWEFPGGKIEQGETPEHALVREIKEELGIETKTSCFAPLNFTSFVENGVNFLIFFYVCRVWEKKSDIVEYSEYKWVKPIDLLSYNILKSNYNICAFIRDVL